MFDIPDWSIGVGIVILFGAVGIALLVRLLPPETRKSSLPSAPPDGTIADLERRLAALEDVPRRLSEIEERLDFAERLVVQQRDAERLPGPSRRPEQRTPA